MSPHTNTLYIETYTLLDSNRHVVQCELQGLITYTTYIRSEKESLGHISILSYPLPQI